MTLIRSADPTAQVIDSTRAWIDLMMPAAELARAIAPTDFVPRAFRNNPPAITAAILYGDEIGLGPMQSLAKIALIEGKPYIAAEAQRALILAAGHSLWPEESSATRATWCGRRAESEQVTRITWTIEDARRAHIDGKPNWRQYPRQMLSARASAELARAVFADVIGGLGAIEESDDSFGDASSATADVSAPSALGTRRKRKPTAAAVPKTSAISSPNAEAHGNLPPLPGEEVEPMPVVEVDPVADRERAQQQVDADVSAANARLHETATQDLLTQRQLTRLQALCRSRGVGDRAARLTLASDVVGRTLGSSKELTVTEADRFIDYLEQLPEVDRDAAESPGLDL